ncbi:MAG: thioredoxin domain-containing protein [bacterium]
MKQKKTIIILGSISVILLAVITMQFSNNKGVLQEHRANSWGRKSIPPPDKLKKLPPDGGSEYNRLVFEKSPYLLQHAGNPVDWYPWGDEAFEKAQKEDKPIFLSIGYSTCHWCHVMEQESFEDREVARLMNATFVCIKVDREERPDIDNIYMAVCQAMTGSGGWPLTIIMTPDKKPFFAGTYFPKESRFQRIGMLDLVPRVAEIWKTQRQKVLESADQITNFLQNHMVNAPGEALGESELTGAYQQLASRFDETYGGFGSAPKFPSPHNFTFLLRYWHRTGDTEALHMVEQTLQAMCRGGIFDHVGFGFHRYSTDSRWLLPHFEKMLYDQAMLAMAYIETYQATGHEEYAQTAHEIFAYVLRDMTSPEGGFYSAEDADSEGEEGKFYLWMPEEINKILGPEEGKWVVKMFNVEPGGNFREQSTGEKTGTSILHLKKSMAELAEESGISEDKLRERWQRARQKLFAVREKRIHPHKDDKILTDWNGLMIAALAKGGRALREPKYAEAARRAADFILTNLRDKHGRLLKRYRQGEAGLPAHLDDYAFLVWGLLELYETSFEVDYLQKAMDLNNRMLTNFWDEKNGGLFFSADSLTELLVRTKEIYDGAIPSGNSVAALNLLRLGRITANEEFEKKAAAIGQAFTNQVKRAPIGYTQLMNAIDFAVGPSYEVVIAGDSKAADTRTMLQALQQRFVPNKIVLLRPTGHAAPPIVKIAKFTRYQTTLNGRATAYVCLNYACKAPTNNVEEMLKLLKMPPEKGSG